MINNISKNFKNSFYINKIKENYKILFISLLLGTIFSVITSPGIMYTDSYSRINLATKFDNSFFELFNNNKFISLDTSSWLTVVPSFFMGLCLFFTGNILLYTILQSFFFFLVTFLLIKKLNTPYKYIQYILFSFSPLIYCTSVFFEPGIGCLTGIVVLILILSSSKISMNKLDIIIEAFLIILFSFITFGYRANAFTIIFVLIAYILLKKCKKVLKIIYIISILIGCIFVKKLPVIYNIDTMSSVSAGFAWEIITMIQHMDLDKQQYYIDYLDDIGGSNATLTAISKSNDNSISEIISGEGLNIFTLSAEGASNKIIRKYIKLFFKEPFIFMSVKSNFIFKTLGINYPIKNLGYEYNLLDQMDNYKYNDCNQRHEIVNIYNNSKYMMPFLIYRPFIVFILTLILLILYFKMDNKNKMLYLFIYLISIFYYGAFIINTQSFELRYFYPSLYLMIIIDVSMISSIINLLIIKYKNRN